MQSQTTSGFRLSPQQKLLWQAAPQGRAQLQILLEGRLDPARLQNAIRQLVERHEILRTAFPRSVGMKAPFQVVNGPSAAVLEGRLEPLHQDNDRHLLTLELPALCADFASLNNLFLELARSYAGEPLEDPLQYADYSEWHNHLAQNEDQDEDESVEALAARDFWAQRDLPQLPPLALPFALKTETQEGGSARATIALPPCDATPDHWLAAWQILLWRLTGQTEVVVGRVFEGRNHEEFASALGLYERVVPEYSDFHLDLSFAAVINRVRQSREEAAPFEDYAPVETNFDPTAGFRLQETPGPRMADMVRFSLLSRAAYTPFHIELRCSTHGAAELVYDPARFTRDAVESMAQRLLLLLNAAPQTLAAELPLMGRQERHQVLVAFNRTAAEYPRDKDNDKCLHQLFEEQAARTPQNIALCFENTRFTYAQLNERANQVAHALRARGVHANTAVGLLFERSADMIVGLLGIFKAGGCYVPLLPDHPPARLAHQLSEAGATVVLTREKEKLAGGLSAFGGEVLCLDRDRELMESGPTNNPALNTMPSDLAYVIYTSGSTGAPKGVAVRHSNLVNYSRFIRGLLLPDCSPVTDSSAGGALRFATVSTLAADLGNTCIFPALISGGCLHVIGLETATDPNKYAEYAAAHPIDVLKITPSHLTALLDGAGEVVLPRKFLICGGEPLSWALQQRIQQAGCAVINHYGPTEATVGCCTFNAREGGDASAWTPATVPIGRPIANAEVYILGPSLQPVPIGVAGELCIGGAGIAQGYLNQPEQTAERFIPNPFSDHASDHDNARLYRTGDLARFLPSGDIEFLGRIDRQVKVRGFRVEPAEIEAALRRHPAVRQAVAVPEADASGDLALAAYIVSDKTLGSEELRSFLRQHLPEYMLPSRLISVPAIPLTPNGKADTRALAALGAAQTQAQTARAFAAPRNSSEEKLVAIWTEILKLERVGIDDNFFEIGGHSLLATQIISRIRAVFSVRLPLHSFLEHPTIASVARKIADCPAAESEEETLARLLQELDGISEEEAQSLLASALKPQEKPARKKEQSAG